MTFARFIFAGSVLLLAGATVRATPRLAATYAQDCHLCHVNPTGGGMRNTFATRFMLPNEIALRPLSAHENSRLPDPQISEQISLGADIRLLYLATDNVSTGSGTIANNTFFQMQGDVYLAIEADPDFTLYLDKGLRSGFEVFVIGRVLPWHGYFKAGQFVPDIGWRWDDHNRYTREKLGLDFPGAADAGLEIGLRPGRLVASAGLFNGAGGGPFDNNSQKMIVGRVLYRLGRGKLQAAIGGSARWNHGPKVRERLWGLQAQASWGPFAYIGDFYGQRLTKAGETRTWAWLFSQEFDVKPHRGLDFFVGYDFLDPDLDHESGTQTQISFGSRIYLRHFLKIEPVYRIEEGENPPGRRSNNRLEIILHAFY